MGSRDALSILAGVALLAVAVVFAVDYVDLYDSTCGTVLYDTRRGGDCSGPMFRQTLYAGFCLIGGLALLAWPLVGRARHQPARLAIALIALGLATVLGAVAIRTTAQPQVGCGSVLNPVKYDGQSDPDPPGCGDYWSRQLRRGLTTGAAALVIGMVGVAAAWPRSRQG